MHRWKNLIILGMIVPAFSKLVGNRIAASLILNNKNCGRVPSLDSILLLFCDHLVLIIILTWASLFADKFVG